MPNLKKIIKLEKNFKFCLNSGFGTLITAETDEDYRNAIISIHNGVELLMKYYLREKNKILIIQNIDYQCLIYGRGDLVKPLEPKIGKTISFDECINILKYFSKLPETYSEPLRKLNNLRNACVHYEFWYVEEELRKLLISNIYEFIFKLISEMNLNPKDFILHHHINHLDKFKHAIDDPIRQKYYRIIQAAIKHYFTELTADERKQKSKLVHYKKKDLIKKLNAQHAEIKHYLGKKLYSQMSC